MRRVKTECDKSGPKRWRSRPPDSSQLTIYMAAAASMPRRPKRATLAASRAPAALSGPLFVGTCAGSVVASAVALASGVVKVDVMPPVGMYEVVLLVLVLVMTVVVLYAVLVDDELEGCARDSVTVLVSFADAVQVVVVVGAEPETEVEAVSARTRAGTTARRRALTCILYVGFQCKS